jgi:hypothetical protein
LPATGPPSLGGVAGVGDDGVVGGLPGGVEGGGDDGLGAPPVVGAGVLSVVVVVVPLPLSLPPPPPHAARLAAAAKTRPSERRRSGARAEDEVES